LELLDRGRGPERDRLGTVAVARDDEALAGLRGLERRGEQERRVGRPRVAEPAEERILEALGGDAQPARRVAVAARIRRAERDPGAVARADAQALEEAGDRLGEARRVALLHDKAVLPAVDEGIALAAPEVDDLVGHREAALEARDRVGLADEEGDRAVAEVRLEPRARRREPAVA